MIKKKYDFLIVGAGFFGAICASELSKKGLKCLVIDKRNHIGGNCFTENRDGINVHIYGPHIFHTSNDRVWDWINQYALFNNFRLMPVANYKGEIYSLPFNMWTFNQLWGVNTPEQAQQIIESQSISILEPSNLEEQAIKSVGKDVYEKLIKGYTAKQWMREPKTLPKDIIKRLPVRFTYDSNYFNDKYQGIPVGGYTKIFEKLLNGIEVRLNVDFIKSRAELMALAAKVIYTGPIDEFFDYQFGELEYKSTTFEHKRLDIENYQGTPMMNFTDIDIPFTRVVEHKHFEDSHSPVSWVTWEYPQKYIAGVTEAYYPVNDAVNNAKYQKYFELTKGFDNILFGGRLAEYKYYDMHNVIERALQFIDKVSIVS
jgi:UDP-galactopyranose mutase